jgi:hypothetical protein
LKNPDPDPVSTICPGSGSGFNTWIHNTAWLTTVKETHHNHEVIGELLEGNEELLIVLPIDGVEPRLA